MKKPPLLSTKLQKLVEEEKKNLLVESLEVKQTKVVQFSGLVKGTVSGVTWCREVIGLQLCPSSMHNLTRASVPGHGHIKLKDLSVSV